LHARKNKSKEKTLIKLREKNRSLSRVFITQKKSAISQRGQQRKIKVQAVLSAFALFFSGSTNQRPDEYTDGEQ
jgi:hypothetical protein